MAAVGRINKMNKKIILPILFILVLGFLFSFSVQEARAIKDTFEATASCKSIYDNPDCDAGECASASASWNAVHDRTTGGGMSSTTRVYLSTCLASGKYTMALYRSYVYFDTSSLPGDASISEVVLKLYGKDTPRAEFGSWNLQVQKGTSATYPHDPLQLSDFYYARYTDNGGTLSSSSMGTGYRSITLNPTGRSWINKTGTTKFALREREHDINDSRPGFYSSPRYNMWTFYGTNATYPALLEVTYTLPITAPDVSTNVATISSTQLQNNQATLNGEIDNTGGEDCDKRGFVYGSGSIPSDPGSVAPGSSGYDNYVEDLGSYTPGAFTKERSLSVGEIMYYRAYAHNSMGYSYGAEKQVVIYQDSGLQYPFETPTPCECSSSDVGGCCDSCYFSPAGKVYGGGGIGDWVDATAATKCSATVNNCTADPCSGEKKYPECQSGGICDSSATTYYTSDPVYASASKVLTSTCTDQDATSQALSCDSNTNYWCTAGNCSGYYRYSECNGDGTCDNTATTNYYQIDVTANAGKVLTSTCTDQDATAATKCSATVNNCTADPCSGEKKYPECQSGGICDSSATTYYTSDPVYADTGYTLTATCGTAGITYCGDSGWNQCGGMGSPYSCRKGKDMYRCAADHSCTYDTSDDQWQDVAAGSVCTGSGVETPASATYYCGFSAYNGPSADKCDKKKDYLACNGSNVCNYGDYGDVYDPVSAYKIANSSGQEVDASSADNTGTCHDCTDGSCSGTYQWGECNGSGNAGPCATYNEPETVYASAGKVLTSSCDNQDATVDVKCAATVNNCTAGQCSGEKKYPECQSGGVCDSSAITYYTSDPFYASAGCSLTSSCEDQCDSTIESQLCDSTWRASTDSGDNYYGKGGYYNCQGMCDGSGLCEYAVNCTPIDTTSPTTAIKIIRTSTGEDVTAAEAWLRADTYTIEFEDNDPPPNPSGLKYCEYYIYACDVGGTNCTTEIVPLTIRNCNWSTTIDAGIPPYNLEGLGRCRIYSGAIDNLDNSGTDYKYLNTDFTPPATEIE
jgi:hypothetical protein